MRIPKDTRRFRKDYLKLQKSGRRKMEKLDEVIRKLIRKEIMAPIRKNHELQGMWKGFWNCHIEGDWVLIYQLGKDKNGNETITFHATDNHSNLFK